MNEEKAQPRHRAGVIGSPIAHSLSPVLHRAAYRTLGLADWDYRRFEIGAGQVAAFVAGLDHRWSGLSVTMPGKEEALALAAEVTERAQLSGAANTLIRTPAGWLADNTDIDGIQMALAEAECTAASTAWVVGSGATARSALIALADIGVTKVYVQVRSDPREQTVDLAGSLGMALTVVGVEAPGPSLLSVDVAISTVPAGTAPVPSTGGGDPREDAGATVRRRTASRPVVLDVAYHPRRSQWADALAAHGGCRVDGAAMLLYQAVAQVELMTGHRPPLESMRAALADALDSDGRNPW